LASMKVARHGEKDVTWLFQTNIQDIGNTLGWLGCDHMWPASGKESTESQIPQLNSLEAKACKGSYQVWQSTQKGLLSSRIEATQDTNDNASCGDGNWEEHCVPSSIK
jgi:hypothetical protein